MDDYYDDYLDMGSDEYEYTDSAGNEAPPSDLWLNCAWPTCVQIVGQILCFVGWNIVYRLGTQIRNK